MSNNKIWICSVLVLLAMCFAGAGARSDESLVVAQKRLWDEVAYQVLRLRAELGFDALSPSVQDALMQVPREQFVPEAERHNAFENRPLPIGYGQTISQPLIVAVMTELLHIKPGDRVFELGTGSGYQAAILDTLGHRSTASRSYPNWDRVHASCSIGLAIRVSIPA